MEETVFFNLGNALASKRDQKELIKEAQIAKDTRKIPGKLIIVEDEENGTHILFELADQTEPSTETKEFKVKKATNFSKFVVFLYFFTQMIQKEYQNQIND